MVADRRAHWDRVYAARSETELSWFEPVPALSLELAVAAGLSPGTTVIDIGGGAARFVDALLERGVATVTVLDLSRAALAAAKRRLGARAEHVSWVCADVTAWMPDRSYDLWHDRAVFHFLTEAADREAYVARLEAALRPGGHAIIATFGLDGPERCSGLPVVRYSPETLAATLGAKFDLVASRAQRHPTPTGAIQSFQFSLLRRT